MAIDTTNLHSGMKLARFYIGFHFITNMAVDAMHASLDEVMIDGTVQFGEGEEDQAPKLFTGEKVGTGEGPKVDIALMPIEGPAIVAKGAPNALSIFTMTEEGGFLNVPDIYMNKIAIGSGFPDDVVSLDEEPADNLKALASAKGVDVSDLLVEPPLTGPDLTNPFQELIEVIQPKRFSLLEAFVVHHESLDHEFLQGLRRPDTKLRGLVAVHAVADSDDGIQVVELYFPSLSLSLNGTVLGGMFQNGTNLFLGKFSRAHHHTVAGTNQTASDLQEDFILPSVVCGWLGEKHLGFTCIQAQSGLAGK
jgi:hypothetical protein